MKIAFLSNIEERPGPPKKRQGLADVAAHALRLLQHAQSGLHLLCLNLLIDWIFISNLPRRVQRISLLSGMSISSFNHYPAPWLGFTIPYQPLADEK
jgi:hypothetical protein